MFPSPGAEPGFTRYVAPSTSLRLIRTVAASLAIAVVSLGAILALTLLSPQATFAL